MAAFSAWALSPCSIAAAMSGFVRFSAPIDRAVLLEYPATIAARVAFLSVKYSLTKIRCFELNPILGRLRRWRSRNGLITYRQCEVERTPFAVPAFNPNFSTVRLNDAFGDIQAKPRA